jgi:hypothetical protein
MRLFTTGASAFGLFSVATQFSEALTSFGGKTNGKPIIPIYVPC